MPLPQNPSAAQVAEYVLELEKRVAQVEADVRRTMMELRKQRVALGEAVK